MRSLYEILDSAQELLERGWVSGHLALDAHGKPVSPTSEKAERYCQIGALMAIAHYEASHSSEDRLVKFCNSVINMSNSGMARYEQIPQRNDTNSKADAIAVFERAKKYVATKLGINYVPAWLVADRKSMESVDERTS